MVDTLKIIYFDGADSSEDWVEGELKGYLIKTNSDFHFFAKWSTLLNNFTHLLWSFSVKNPNAMMILGSACKYFVSNEFILIYPKFVINNI